MKKKSKVLLIIGGVIILGSLIAFSMMSNNSNATKIYAEKVGEKGLTEEVSASGYIQPKTQVNVTSQVTAEIIAINVKDGDEVMKGQVLVQLDTVQLKKDVEQTEFSLNEIKARTEGAKTQYTQADEEYERQKELYEKDLSFQSALDNAKYAFLRYKSTYEAMLAQTKQAKARFEQADDNLGKTTIVAPISGVITYIDAEEGEIAAAQTPYSMGRTLMIVSNLSTFEVEVDVDETEIVKIELGQKADIEIDAFIDTSFVGEVVEIGNTAVMSSSGTEQATNFKVKVQLMEENPSIRPGMSATVDIITNTKENVLSIPYGAVVMRNVDLDSMALANSEDSDSDETTETETEEVMADDETESDADNSEGEADSLKKRERKEIKGVFIVREKKAFFVQVETGIADQKDIEIIGGITAEDTVITGPYRELRSIKHKEAIEIIENPSESKDM